jgi:hypothetical protein
MKGSSATQNGHGHSRKRLGTDLGWWTDPQKRWHQSEETLAAQHSGLRLLGAGEAGTN